MLRTNYPKFELHPAVNKPKRLILLKLRKVEKT